MNEEQVCVVRRRRSRQEVEQVVAEYESSGLSRIEFCRERGVALSTLGRHLKKQSQEQRASGKTLVGESRLISVELSAAPPAATETQSSVLTVLLSNGRRVEVGCDFDAETLARLVPVLEKV